MENNDLRNLEHVIEILKIGDQINLISLKNLILRMQMMNMQAQEINRMLEQNNIRLKDIKPALVVRKPKPRKKLFGIF